MFYKSKIPVLAVTAFVQHQVKVQVWSYSCRSKKRKIHTSGYSIMTP